MTAAWEHYCDWKKISSEAEPGSVSLETLVKGTCERTRPLDLVENFTLFEERAGKIRKVVAKNHQYLGVNNAINAVLGLQHNRGLRWEQGIWPFVMDSLRLPTCKS